MDIAKYQTVLRKHRNLGTGVTFKVALCPEKPHTWAAVGNLEKLQAILGKSHVSEQMFLLSVLSENVECVKFLASKVKIMHGSTIIALLQLGAIATIDIVSNQISEEAIQNAYVEAVSSQNIDLLERIVKLNEKYKWVSIWKEPVVISIDEFGEYDSSELYENVLECFPPTDDN